MLPLEEPLATRVETLLGDRLVAARPAPGGYSAAQRWLATTRGGATVFVKVGATPVSARFLRQEVLVYERLHLPCMPEVYGWDAASPPLLLLSDLSRGTWPPPWTAESVDHALQAIDSVHGANATLPKYSEVHDAAEDWWDRLAAAPEAFLAMELVSPKWFDRNLELLGASARAVSGAGSSVTHFDLRSDNFCFYDGHTYLVDWSHACLGNARLDLGLFLPGLNAEGGPPPEAVLPDEPAVASWVAGFFAWHASKPGIPTAPRVRAMQRIHLESALPWAARALSLEPLTA
jgi:hypothetical protein